MTFACTSHDLLCVCPVCLRNAFQHSEWACVVDQVQCMTHDQHDQSKWFRHSTTAHGFRWRSTFAQQEQKLKLNLWKVDYFFPRFSLNTFSPNTNSRGLMIVGSNWQGCCEKSAMRHETQISVLQLHCSRPFSLSRLVSATCLWFWSCWRICPKRPVSWGW